MARPRERGLQGDLMRFLSSFLIALAAAAVLLGCAREPERCWVCLREIHSQVRAVVTLADGQRVTACCPRCALHYREEPGNRVSGIQLTDYTSHRPLPLERAYFVEGSEETPCVHEHGPMMNDSGTPMQVCYDRCMPSLIGFSTEEAARAFMVQHGGVLHAPGTFPAVAGASR